MAVMTPLMIGCVHLQHREMDFSWNAPTFYGLHGCIIHVAVVFMHG